MTDTSQSPAPYNGLMVTSIVMAFIALASGIAVLILSIFKFGLDLGTLYIIWWAAFAIMVVNLIISMIVSKKNMPRRKLSLISMYFGLATAILLIISLFLR